MLSFSRRLIYTLSNKILRRKRKYDRNTAAPEQKLSFDFAKIKKSPFDIKSENSYNANLSNDGLALKVKKTNCIAWVEMPNQEFQDHIIEAKIRLDSCGGYAATGLLFRIMDDSSYYIALVSGKGYFRLDAVKDGAPYPLIAWTEISNFNENNINLKIITNGSFLTFIVNGKWIGEVSDDLLLFGRIGFALASYEDEKQISHNDQYTCIAYLNYISIDSRLKKIEEEYKKWTDDSNIDANERLRLAETFAVMGEAVKSLEQINRAWKRRDEAIRSVTISYTEVRTRKELLLAARMSFHIGQYKEAEEYINAILSLETDSAEAKLAFSEKIKVLYELKRFDELKQFVIKNPFKINKDIDYYILIAHTNWELKEYKESAAAWDQAAEMDKENGVYAANAANAHEFAGNKKKALSHFIAAGKIFLNQGNNAELAAIMPKLSALGKKDWEARNLAGKWAYSIEDYGKSEKEFAAAHKLRTALKPSPQADPAAYYLWALVLNLKDRNKEAIQLLERAVKIAPDYGLFRFKLAEIKIKIGKADKNIAGEFKLALKNFNDDDEQKRNMANYAGNLLRSAGDTKNANYFFNTANNDS
ncbi:MAG: hypothetical protein FWB73_04325 [Treponema sp.]|nr:hypothetical protein [Treponema sp.]